MNEALFVFSGQGAQTVGMGADLYESSSAASVVFDKANSVLGWSVSDL
ncbi:MAG: acyltransferase domain-containing protein, partial [Victivallales bacterium]|nr:acyltransferase domain-containing protein [Victivallales bacterium]